MHTRNVITRNVTLIRVDISRDSVHVSGRSVILQVVFGVAV